MAFKISKIDQNRLKAVAAEIRTERSTLEDAVRVYNEAVKAAREALQPAIDTYTDKTDAAHGLLEDLHRDVEEQYDNKSDKWKDGDTASSVKEWIDGLSELVVKLENALNIDEVVDLDIETVCGEDDLADAIEAIEPEPEE